MAERKKVTYGVSMGSIFASVRARDLGIGMADVVTLSSSSPSLIADKVTGWEQGYYESAHDRETCRYTVSSPGRHRHPTFLCFLDTLGLLCLSLSALFS